MTEQRGVAAWGGAEDDRERERERREIKGIDDVKKRPGGKQKEIRRNMRSRNKTNRLRA